MTFKAIFAYALLLACVSAQSSQPLVGAGVAALAEQCQIQQQSVAALVDALDGDDLDAVKAAYQAARPPYEQIEVLAACFEDLDEAIDARAYAFDTGELGEDFRGFHRIEACIYREEDIECARPYARPLRRTINELCDVLDESSPEVFNRGKTWDGALGLTVEIGSKKIASEEETYSDLSLLIFRENLKGIWAVISPYEAEVEAETWDNLVSAYNETVATLNEVDPENGFEGGEGATARPYSEVSVEERKQISDEIYAFFLALEAANNEVRDGQEAANLPEGATRLQMAPAAAVSRQSERQNEAVLEGVAKFETLCASQQELAADLLAAIDTGDLDASREAYVAARPPYEQIEVLAGSFEEEDTNIDSRPYAHNRGELDEGFRGMHVAEYCLFRDNDLDCARAAVTDVQGTIDSLCNKIGNAANDPDNFNFANTWDGLKALSVEVPAKKISSEEETWSDHSLLIFTNNAKGIESQVTMIAYGYQVLTSAKEVGTGTNSG
uniref:Imelysin-like domain-containing protein n=1 Tax=Rhodosorus marinus TaxID=101924 RepID=A0A6T6LKB7_9RHOD|mmetsp:Transcript_17795/g.25671  ORF Transcript_17795/g.25671 Transcript_17795/m.25671 type:complete len:499 (+) Transcript_17795:196-1692(+)